MLLLKRVDSTNQDFVTLVVLLDADLAQRDGAEHGFYAQFNKIDALKFVVLAFENDHAVSCGAMKEIETGTIEIKRMFTLAEKRGKGIAAKVLAELEAWATELNVTRLVLETGKKQPEAIALYTSCGYNIIANYSQYKNVENSICFEKKLSQTQ